jgi:hypothetical protein
MDAVRQNGTCCVLDAIWSQTKISRFSRKECQWRRPRARRYWLKRPQSWLEGIADVERAKLVGELPELSELPPADVRKWQKRTDIFQ